MSERPLRIAYFGLPLGAVLLARAGFVPTTICLGHPDAAGARRVRRRFPSSLVLGRPDLSDAGVMRAIESAGPEVILSWFWPQRIPARVLALAPRGAFGVHPSLLPRWRGPDPYYWALRSGDAITGVTLHRLAEDYDTGAIIAQASLPIVEGEHALELARRLDRPSLRLLLDCARRLARGEALVGEPQDEALATEAPAPAPEQLAIRFEAPCRELLRLIRAAAPEPGATFELDGEEVTVQRAHAYGGRLPRALEPRDAVLTREGVTICCADGGLVLDRVRVGDDVFEGEEIAELFPDTLARVWASPPAPLPEGRGEENLLVPPRPSGRGG